MPANDPTSSRVLSQGFDQFSFHEDTIDAILVDGIPHVSIRRICENLKRDLSDELKKLRAKPWATIVFFPTVASDGKIREVALLPLSQLPMWMATCDVNRIKDEVLRAKVELYQKEVTQCLAAYYTPKAAAIEGNPFVGTQRPLSPAEALLQSVQLMVDIERRQKEIESRVASIESVRTEATQGLLSLPREVDAPQKTYSSMTVERCRLYARANHIEYVDVFNKLHKEVYYRIGIDAAAQQRNNPVLFDSKMAVYREQPIEIQRQIYAIACEICPCSSDVRPVG